MELQNLGGIDDQQLGRGFSSFALTGSLPEIAPCGNHPYI